jgi:ribonuclease P protein component
VLERRHRLTATSEFTSTTRAGRRAGTRTLVVHLAARQPVETPLTQFGADDAPRVGFAVARTVGNAVRRNRVKRRLRHLLREQLSRLPRSADLVVRALAPSSEASYADLGRDLDKALGRLGVQDTADREPEPVR